MKKHMFAAAACSLALLFGALPVMAACGGGDTSAEGTIPEVTPPEDDTPSLPPDETSPAPDVPADGAEPSPEEPPQNGGADGGNGGSGESDNGTDNGGAEEPTVKRAEYILVRTDGLNVRHGAGTSYSSLGQADSGDMLHLAGKQGDWYETRYRGTTAYVSAKAAYTAVASLEKADDKIERVIDEGLKLLGVPYVYGAVRLHDGKGNFLKNFTTNAFDCSSLMQYIFYKGAGILLDVTTRTQVKQGTAVSWKNIKRGDLLFYTNAQRYNKTGVERIGHVAM